MRQLIVECSDPGVVVSLAEEFENVLRQLDFARVESLRQQLSDLARELGAECQAAWRPFRIEVPNDGARPPSFGTREVVDEERVQGLLAQAAERGIGHFQMSHTSLLPEGGPAPETREQYIRDLADAVSSACWHEHELHVFRYPVELPTAMAAHRQHLMDEYVTPTLKARANFPTVGDRWIQDSLKHVKERLHEVSTRSEAVMEYALSRSDPAELDPLEHIRWAVLAARLGKQVDKWTRAAEQPFSFVYLRFALGYLLWTECQGSGSARPFLEQYLQELIVQAKTVYTTEALAAFQLVYDDLTRMPWERGRWTPIVDSGEHPDA